MNRNNNSEALPLTNREMEILTYMAYGTSSKEIAGELFISLQTVKNHRKNMLKKMSAKNSTELVRMFVQKVYEQKNDH